MSRFDAIRAPIGRRMHERRRMLGMTQQQCADLLGISRLSVARIELGYRRIQLPELATICDILGCSAADLLGDDGLAAAAARNRDRLYGAPADAL